MALELAFDEFDLWRWRKDVLIYKVANFRREAGEEMGALPGVLTLLATAQSFFLVVGFLWFGAAAGRCCFRDQTGAHGGDVCRLISEDKVASSRNAE